MTALDSIFTEFRAPDNTPLHGKSVTEVNAREVSEDHTAVTRYDLYRTTSADAAAEHVERRERLVEGGELTPVPLPETFSRPPGVSADIPDAREALADRPPDESAERLPRTSAPPPPILASKPAETSTCRGDLSSTTVFVAGKSLSVC
ncbi:hypothetical protein FXW78_18730 [Rhodococcus opacus]|nr:hypothetical protein [Rhodococcus opacus]